MSTYSLTLTWSDEDGGYIATSPEFPGLSAFGETAEEALAEAQVALELFVKTHEDEGIPLPAPERIEQYSGQFRVRIPSSLHRQIAQLAARNRTSLNSFVLEALSEKVGAERIGERIIREMRQFLATNNLAMASRFWSVGEPVAVEKVVTTERSTELVYSTAPRNRKAN